MREVIAGESYYSVPDYQRPYAWTEENIEDFWSDITKAFERKESGYFLDKIILVKRPDGLEFEVVDGQQRLTTTVLFLSVLRDYFFKNEERALANVIQDSCLKKSGKYRLYTRPEERAAFEDGVLKQPGVLGSYAVGKLPSSFRSAVARFGELIEEKRTEIGEENITAYLRDFYYFFLDGVSLIVITTDGLASAYTIFETINNRGQALDTKDLLKNFLLRRLQEETDRHNTEYPNARKSFDDEKRRFLGTWREIEGAKAPMNDLLRHHRVAVVGDRSRQDLFRDITEDIRAQRLATEAFMDDWKRSVDAYGEIRDGQWHGETLTGTAKKNLLMLRNVGHEHWIPVLIAAWRNGWSRTDAEGLAAALERFCGLSFVAGYSSRGILSTLLGATRAVKANEATGAVLARLEAFLRRNRVFRDAEESLLGDVYNSRGKYALAKYEYSLLDDSVIREIPFDATVQLEHILPQTMSDGSWKERFSEEEHDRLINTIGNITLLAGSMTERRKSKNQSASNKPFVDKVKIYSGETNNDGLSAFRMTQEVAAYKDWTPEAVERRTKLIVSSLLKTWDVQEPSEYDTGNTAAISPDDISLSPEDIRFRLEETLERGSDLTPRFVVFLKALLSEDRSFTQEELRANLYDNGIGNDLGQAGRYLSNISQFVTNVNNAHLRAIIAYDLEHDRPGARKDNYRIRDEYRDLVCEALAKL